MEDTFQDTLPETAGNTKPCILSLSYLHIPVIRFYLQIRHSKSSIRIEQL